MKTRSAVIAFGAILLTVGVGVANGQRFEAASIRLNTSGSGSASYNDHRGSFQATNVSLSTLIRDAYGLKDYETSAPDWMDSQRFDVAARFSLPASDEEIRRMKQGMLEDRFQLKWHRETKETPVYVLEVGKSGMKFGESGPDATPTSNMNGRGGSYSLKATKIGMDTLCTILSRNVKLRVRNATGLIGVYDLSLRWQDEKVDSAEAASLPVLSDALSEQLGLKLELRKEPAEIFVVDRAEKIPTEN